MKRLAYAALLVLSIAIHSHGQSLDAYGGRTDIKCTQATGWFHTEKIGNRWWLCTPSGHGFFFEGIGAMNGWRMPKYNGSDSFWATAQLSQIKSWNFNAVGQMSSQWVEPMMNCSGCAGWPGGRQPYPLPEVQTLSASNYAAVNLWNYASRPVKNMRFGLNGNYTGWRASIMDFFEPQYGPWLDGFFANDQAFLKYKTSPYFVGIFIDDTDWFWGMGAGPDFHTIPEGRTNSHVGFMTLITSPMQTYSSDPASRGIPEVYSDTKVYSKTAMANPPANCSIQTPCSLRDYLYKKYNGNIAALNAAWRSNYTTFDSSGMLVTGEVIGTGDGTKTTFSATLAHAQVSPESFLLKVGKAAQGGDCPWFNGCNVIEKGTGSIAGAAESMLAAGRQPWLSDFTARDCGGCGLPAASYWVRIAFHMKPGLFGSPSREVGNTYQSRNQQIVVPAPLAFPGATGWDVYVVCANFRFGGVKWCLPAGQVGDGKETLQASNIPFNQSWIEPTAGLTTNGASVPGPPGAINYANGQVAVTFSNPLPKGKQVTADYVSGGWMYGSGLMDEDGRHSAWLGTNAICLSPATVCDGRDYPKPTANVHVAEDLDGWIAQFAAEYFGTIRARLKAAAPHMLYFGADTVGTWGVPPRKQILQGAEPYVDGLFTQWFGNQPDQNTANQQYAFLTQYFDKPLMNFTTMHAQRDSAMAGHDNSNCCFGLDTQPMRGQQWNIILTKMLNMPSSNGTYQWVGISWWGLYDFGNELIDWGLKTPSDNAYDGREAVMAIVSCSIPLQALRCGGEAKNYGDLITPVKKANLLWLTVR